MAFRRFLVIEGIDRPATDDRAATGGHNLGAIANRWLTTPYVHLEAAAAYQIGLPIVLFVEDGVIQEGALESGVLSMYPPTFDLDDTDIEKTFFGSGKWQQLINTWEGQVREVVHNKGRPPQLYQR